VTINVWSFFSNLGIFRAASVLSFGLKFSRRGAESAERFREVLFFSGLKFSQIDLEGIEQFAGFGLTPF